MTGAAAYGKTVWSWHPWLVSSCRWRIRSNRIDCAIKPAAMEARRIRLQGERGISRQTIAQGMPECSGCTCMLVCALPRAHCTRDRGCSKHPAFPAPSRLRERNFSKPRAQCVARTRTCISIDRRGCSADTSRANARAMDAQRNPGAVSMRSENPGLRSAPSGLRGWAV